MRKGPHAEIRREDVRADRFWSKVRKSDGCWFIPNSRSQREVRQPQFSVNGVMHGAHRVAYALEHGRASSGVVVRRSCNNTYCVRPSHLVAGAISDAQRGRRSNHHLHERWTVVCAIRQAAVEGTPTRQLAQFFGLDMHYVSRVIRNEVWKSSDYTKPRARSGPGARSLSRQQVEDAYKRWTSDPDHLRRRGGRVSADSVTIASLAREFGVGLATMYDMLHERLKQVA